MSRQKLIDEKRCRLCQRGASVRGLTRHHLVPQRWFMGKPIEVYRLRNDYDNVVPLCRPCHDLVEAEPKVRAMFRRSFTKDEEIFCVRLRGRAWLNRMYPYWDDHDENEVLRMIENAPYRKSREQVQQDIKIKRGGEKIKMVHKYGCDPLNGCVAGCPVAAKYGTFYPSVKVGHYR